MNFPKPDLMKKNEEDVSNQFKSFIDLDYEITC